MATRTDRILTELLEDSKVRFVSVLIVVVFILSGVTGVCLFIYKESSWRTNIQRDILETRNAVNEIKAIVETGSHDRFTYSQMKRWIQRFKELNETSEIKIPTLPDGTQ